MAAIEDLKAKVNQKRGLARANLFSVELPRIAEAAMDGRELNVLCRDIVLPGRQILSNERLIGSHLERVAFGYAVTDISCTFLCLNDYGVRTYFEAWQNTAFNQETNEIGYSHGTNGYAKSVKIHQLEKSGNPRNILPEFIRKQINIPGLGFLPAPQNRKVYSLELQYAYPTTMSAITFNNELDGIIELNVQLSYKNWKRI